MIPIQLKAIKANDFVEIFPDDSSLAEKGEAKSPQESPSKAIYFSFLYAYSLINEGYICQKNVYPSISLFENS